METKKYKLTDETIQVFCHTLYRIEALKDFGNVKKGDKGGFIEKENNLSQDGDCWVYNNAKVFSNAVVSNDALVFDNAKVYDRATVYGEAMVSGDAEVYGDAEVWCIAKVFGKAIVHDNAEVCGGTEVSENANVYGDAYVSGDARIWGNASIYGNAEVWGNARVYNNARVCGNAKVCGNTRISGDAKVESAFDCRMQNSEYIDLSQVWHDASEEPKSGKRICVHFGEDTCGIYTRLGKDENKWCDWCRVAHALRWAYISDLLPKQFRNSKQEKGGEK